LVYPEKKLAYGLPCLKEDVPNLKKGERVPLPLRKMMFGGRAGVREKVITAGEQPPRGVFCKKNGTVFIGGRRLGGSAR